MTVSESLLLFATGMAVWQWHEVLYDKSPACCTLTLGGAVTEMFFLYYFAFVFDRVYSAPRKLELQINEFSIYCYCVLLCTCISGTNGLQEEVMMNLDSGSSQIQIRGLLPTGV